MNIKNNKNCKITINDEGIAVSEKEKTADELFKEIGYKNTFHNFYEHDFGTSITFSEEYKEISVNGHIGTEELQAINRKVRELRLDIMNKCKYLTIRTKNYEKYFYCRLNKKIINYTVECVKCVKNEPRKNKSINKVSKKKITVTQDTYNKVMQRDNGRCRLCGTSLNLHLHHIDGRGKDLTNDINNCIMLCRHCHLEVVHKNQKKYRPLLKKLL